MTSRKSLGSMRAESAVEPTRSENISDLTALGGVDGRARGYSTRRGPRRLCTRAKHSNSFQELESSPKRNADLAEMILRQIVQNRVVDGVLAECLILFEAKAPQPTSEVHEDALTCPARMMMVPAKQHVHCKGSSCRLVGY